MKTILAILLLVLPSAAVEVPKRFGENVRFISTGGEGRLSQQRFLLALFYLVDDLGVADKPLPRILVIHANSYLAEFAGIPEQPGGGIWRDAPAAPDKPELYEFWIRGEGSDAKIAAGLATIAILHYGVEKDQAVAAATRCARKLAAEVDVRSIR